MSGMITYSEMARVLWEKAREEAEEHYADSTGVYNKMEAELFNKSSLATQVGGGHYKDMAIQPAEYSQKNGLNYLEAATVKYVSRHKNKNGRQDIEKAIHCLELLLEWEYNEGT